MNSLFNTIYSESKSYSESKLRLWLKIMEVTGGNMCKLDSVFIFGRNIVLNHVVFLVYYLLYDKYAPRNSLRHYAKLLKGDNSIQRKDSEYNTLIYLYRKFRKLKAKQIKNFPCGKDKPLQDYYINYAPEEKGESIKRLQGHQINDLDFHELLLFKDYKIFERALNGRLGEIKNFSHKSFAQDHFPSIENISGSLYRNVLNADFGKDTIFMRSLLLYSLERITRFEKNYLISKVLNSEKSIEVIDGVETFKTADFKESNMSDNIVVGYNTLLSIYDYPNVCAKDIKDIISIMNLTITDTVKYVFEKIDCKITEQFNLSDDAIEFFENFIGNGQHINEKNLNEIKIKDYRDLYKMK